MMSMTLEQVLNKRHKLVTDMSDGMVFEVRAYLDGSGLEMLQADALRGLLKAVLQQEPSFFNDDANFAAVVQKTLELKQAASGEELKQAMTQAENGDELAFELVDGRHPCERSVQAGAIGAGVDAIDGAGEP